MISIDFFERSSELVYSGVEVSVMNLNQMRHLAPDWNLDNAARPNDTAINNANKIIEIINRPHQLESMLPSVEEGILIFFRNNEFGVFVECYNDGEIGYTLTHNKQPVESVDLIRQQIDPLQFFSTIQTHLGK